MTDCVNCSAPLPANSTLCQYCNKRNDVDLHQIHHSTAFKPEIDRNCPNCSCPMDTINIRSDGKFFIERCDNCMGLFFDVGELEALLEQSVSNVFRIDNERIKEIGKELFENEVNRTSFYINCPVCNEMMHRKRFANQSNVIIDSCAKHGIWLAAGELRKLLEWKKAGGQLLHNKQAQENIKQKELEDLNNKIAADFLSGKDKPFHQKNVEDEMMSSIFGLVNKIF